MSLSVSGTRRRGDLKGPPRRPPELLLTLFHGLVASLTAALVPRSPPRNAGLEKRLSRFTFLSKYCGVGAVFQYPQDGPMLHRDGASFRGLAKPLRRVELAW